jgi:mono/diheme cytochrome c family protein
VFHPSFIRGSFYLSALLLCASVPLWLKSEAAAADQVSYAKQVRPFFARYCLECHNSKKLKAGLDLETYPSLKEGSDIGPVVAAGQPDKSKIVLVLEHKEDPPMPPKSSRQPKADEINMVRAWVAAGAKDDTGTTKVQVPDIKPRVPVKAAVAALAYRPDGKLLAAGVYAEVILIDPATGDVTARLSGQTAQVTALAFRKDGKHLAVASGVVGTSGEVRVYNLPCNGSPPIKPEVILKAHLDLVQDLAFSPDGRLLATCSYDRLIKLWDATTGKEIRTLKDHSDAAYSLAFSPDGGLLASGAADRAVKVWDVATGKRLYTLGEPTDWVYAVAWSPDGQYLAAAGVDKSIRVWEVSARKGKLVHSVFAHEGPVSRLVYAADGKTLYSLSEDRAVKSWSTRRMVERNLYDRQPEAVLALAVTPDHKYLALGRYDGVAQILDETTGKVVAEPLPIKPKPPVLSRLTPSSGRVGVPVRLTFTGKHLDQALEVTATGTGVQAKLVTDSATPNSVQADVTFPADSPAGVYKLGLKSALGQTVQLPFTVDLFTPVQEVEPNDSPRTGQKVALPVSVVGSIGKPGDVDYYRFEAKEHQQIGVQVLTAAVGSKLEPVLKLTDAEGRVLAESTNGLLGFTCPRAGTYALGIRDREYRGGSGMHYRLHVGDIPIITAVFPLGLQQGTEAEFQLEGVHLGKVSSVRVKAPKGAVPGSRLPLPWSGRAPLGMPSVVVGEFLEARSGGDNSGRLPTPGTANGRISKPGATDTWRFTAKKGQRLVVEVNARRLGSPLDSIIEILDAHSRPVPLATLRCLAKTYTTFRDHDSAGPGIRLETWNELAINDYLLVGSELVRIRALPKNPDDDCQFFSVRGQRVTFLGTTSTHHSLGTPMYKVSIHPPGTTFPPNGFPVVTLFYRNDDGGPGYGKDSRLFFDPPADGDYQVRIGDARGEGGSNYAYRLTVRPPRPSFAVSFNPTSPAVWKGSAVPVTVTADRIDGFAGAIEVRLENLPAGFSAPATSIPAGENSTTFALWADPNATTPAKTAPLKLVARARINGQEVLREVAGGLPRVVEPGDIVTATAQSEVTVQPGKQVRLLVTIERRHGFAGRVPLDVRGLPHGVRVLDIGLNGILVTEKEISRTVVIYAEPWVKPTTHPFVVLARSERKGTEHAARSVLLKVMPLPK